MSNFLEKFKNARKSGTFHRKWKNFHNSVASTSTNLEFERDIPIEPSTEK